MLLVAGGLDKDYWETDSVEILKIGDSSWSHTTPLPFAACGLRGGMLEGILYMTGIKETIEKKDMNF